MPLRNLKYSRKVKALFIPLFVLMAIGLAIVYQLAAGSLKQEHHERLQRTARLTEEGLNATGNEMLRLANLFQTNRTLKEYLYISTVLGGESKPLKNLLQPLVNSLGIDDLDLYDQRGRRVFRIDSRPVDDPKEERLTGIVKTLPNEETYGFTESSGTLKLVAVAPLTDENRIVGYISVGNYINTAYLKELKKISGNELFRVDEHNMIGEGPEGKTFPYLPHQGKLFISGASYSVLEKNLTDINNEPLGRFVVAQSDEDLNAATAKLRYYMFAMLGLGAVLSLLMSRLFMKTLVAPLQEITLFTGKVARGELGEELAVTGKDEITTLALHLNNMGKQLRAQRDVVRKYTDNLEQAIAERTSELNKVQRQLLQSQKMEAVGQLAGGIAHDFNNFLTAIIGYAGMYQRKLGEGDPLRVYADQIVATSKRAAELTRSLLTFSRKRIINPAPVDLNEVIANAEKILLRLIGEDVELKTVLPDKPFTIMADSGQLEQVLLNLSTNARDSMPDGGCLIIETRIVRLDENFVKQQAGSRVGDYALMTVTDTGTGMDEATKEKIFEPFFTTKEVGKGTGLGLSMVYGIIQQHQGFIAVYSEVGAGTSFRIYLPLVRGEVVAMRTEEQLLEPVGGTETILLAEDDDTLRELSRTWLEEAGYTVIVSKDGDDTVEKFTREKDRIQLLILDVVMPKKNVKSVSAEIKKLKPGIKILFTSGYTPDYLRERGILDSGVDLIQKPMSTNDLLRKIRSVLDK